MIMENSTDTVLLVLTNCPDKDSAGMITTHILQNKLAACVNIMPEMLSLYTWQGKQESAAEVQLQIKTTALALPALQRLISDLHPYDLPEIIALPVVAGLPAYLQWVQQETGRQ